ncbi:prepilin-type N-terminal cleavage/methylation domain-containing protein [Clostridiaceae bacterium 35-E11]
MKIHKNQGLTLIELIVAFGIAGILMAVIGSFLMTHVKSFHRSANQMELQQQGQFAMDFLKRNIVSARGIFDIEGSLEGANEERNISKIIFDMKEKNDGKLSDLVFELKETNKLFYGVGKIIVTSESEKKFLGSAKTEVANYIKKIVVKPLPEDIIYEQGKYEQAKGINVVIELEKEGEKERISSSFHFRNYVQGREME